MASHNHVYLDYNATTPVDPRVLERMLPFFSAEFANPSSNHAAGRRARSAVETSREQVAELIGARSAQEITFTSGATEASNLAIKGLMAGSSKRHLVTTQAEHKAVLDTVDHLQAVGCAVSYLPVDRSGRIDPDELRSMISDETALVSVIAANNEIGTIAPLADVGAICRERGVLFHTDATQLVGKAPLSVEELGIDLLSLSGHKLYGPKGIGALFARRGVQHQIAALVHGGGHERGLRSGTLNVPGCVGLGAASDVARVEMHAERARLEQLREELLAGLGSEIDGITVNGHGEHRLPGTLNLHFAGVDADDLQLALPEVAMASGSACTSATPEPSHVLLAIGLEFRSAKECVRLSLGRPTTIDDVRFASSRIGATVRLLREESSSPMEVSR